VKNVLIVILFLFSLIFFSCEEYHDEATSIVTFHANDASGTPPSPMKVYNAYANSGSKYLTFYTVDLPGKGNLYYEGKIFYGWNTKANGTGEQYFPTTTPYSPTPEIKEHTTMYAQWKDEYLPPVQNLNIKIGDGFILTWDAVKTDLKIDDTASTYLHDGKKFITYVILRRATNAGVYSTNSFIPFGFSSTPTFRDTRFDISAGGTFEYIVALGIVTYVNPNSTGDAYDIFLGSHSNVSTVGVGFVGAGNFMPAPTMFNVNVDSATSVTLSWRRATNLNSNPCLGFYVFSNVVPAGTTIDGRNWKQENVLIPYNSDADYYTSFRHTYTMSVSPLTTYYFSIAAVYRDGRGELATPIQITTPELPIIVTGLSATAYSSTCINLSWNENDKASSYKIYYEKGDSSVKYVADTVVGTTFSHTGLEPDTVYRYSIKAISIDKENSLFSNTIECKTLLSSALNDPLFLIITNNGNIPLRTISINNEENILSSELYNASSCFIELIPGEYNVTVYDTINRENKFKIIITNTNIRYILNDNSWPLARLTIRNNYSIAISSTFLRLANSNDWGNNRLNGSITTNNSQYIDNMNQGLYEAYATSLQYYRVTSGASNSGITISGVIDGYRDVWYYFRSFPITTNTDLLFPATGWTIFKPE